MQTTSLDKSIGFTFRISNIQNGVRAQTHQSNKTGSKVGGSLTLIEKRLETTKKIVLGTPDESSVLLLRKRELIPIGY